MRSPEEVAREVVQAKTGLAIDRILTEWQAEVAEQVRAEVLAAATWEFRMGGRQQRFRLIGPWGPVEP